jgi:hypothetical protein
MQRKQLILASCVIIILNACVYWQLRPQILQKKSDFLSFYTAGQMVLSGNAKQLYDLDRQQTIQEKIRGTEGLLPYIHPPYECILFVPLALLSYERAFLLFYTLNSALLLAFFWYTLPRFPSLANLHFIIATVAAIYIPTLLSLVQGQDSAFVLLALSICAIAMYERKPILAGAILALGTVKPQFVVPTLFVMFVMGKWRSLVSFAAVMIALLSMTIPIIGFRPLLEYPAFLVRFAQLRPASVAVHPASMANLRGLLDWVGFSSGGARILIVTVSMVVWLGLGLVLRKFGPQDPRQLTVMGTVIAWSVFFGYHINPHDLTLLLYPVIVSLAIVRQRLTSESFRIGLVILFIIGLVVPYTGLYYRVLAAPVFLLGGMLLLSTLKSPRKNLAGFCNEPPMPPLRVGQQQKGTEYR